MWFYEKLEVGLIYTQDFNEFSDYIHTWLEEENILEISKREIIKEIQSSKKYNTASESFYAAKSKANKFNRSGFSFEFKLEGESNGEDK